MNTPVLVQDWVTLRGDKAADQGDTTFLPPRERWIWTGDALAVHLTVEVKSLRNLTVGHTAPTLDIETSVTDGGPWVAVGSGITSPGDYTVTVRFDTNSGLESGLKPSLGFLRWALVDTAVTAGDSWEACFRISGVVVDLVR